MKMYHTCLCQLALGGVDHLSSESMVRVGKIDQLSCSVVGSGRRIVSVDVCPVFTCSSVTVVNGSLQKQTRIAQIADSEVTCSSVCLSSCDLKTQILGVGFRVVPLWHVTIESLPFI